MHQRFWSLVDTWDIDINGEIDERLIVFIPAFVNAAQRRHEEEEN